MEDESGLPRAQWHGPADAPRVVVLLPGLGLPSYVGPTAQALARRGLACAVLDVPGFGSGARLVCAPDVQAMGRAATRWLATVEPDRQLVLLGHSTGSQAALGTALGVQAERPGILLVMAGPTFAPSQRGWWTAGLATLTAYRRDSPAEAVVVPELLRGNLDVARLVRSGLADRPEERIAALTLPLLLTTGRHDSYTPAWWLDRLGAAAVRSPTVTTRVLPGSHNNLFTHPEELAELVDRSVARASD